MNTSEKFEQRVLIVAVVALIAVGIVLLVRDSVVAKKIPVFITKNAEKESKKRIIADLKTADVYNRGVFLARTGQSIRDLINFSGGMIKDADSDSVKIILLNDSDTSVLNCPGKIDVNTAGIDELDTLKGIGKSYAQRIIERREKKKFARIGELKNVSGIGQKKYDDIKRYVTASAEGERVFPPEKNAEVFLGTDTAPVMSFSCDSPLSKIAEIYDFNRIEIRTELIENKESKPSFAPAQDVTTAQEAVKESRLNINTASAKEFMELKCGIGEKKAGDIVSYRKRSGGFKSIEEIKNVKGIGEKTFEKMKDRIRVE